MDIIMNLQPHGWLDISITFSEGEIIEIPVSFLTDSIHELADKSSLLDKDFNEVIITGT
ncbi:hypothetical protein [Paenibacillus sp. FSL R5-0810]|uniref:hypothetical protein n=1 Tax=Paenibacillus sp. FSL R5-0810 TaxID=2921659 RepID=UPI0030FA1D10